MEQTSRKRRKFFWSKTLVYYLSVKVHKDFGFISHYSPHPHPPTTAHHLLSLIPPLQTLKKRNIQIQQNAPYQIHFIKIFLGAYPQFHCTSIQAKLHLWKMPLNVLLEKKIETIQIKASVLATVTIYDVILTFHCSGMHAR